MRGWLLPILLLATPALGEAPARLVLAPAGDCAGEERDLALPPLPKPVQEETPPPASLLHLSPTDVAANATRASVLAPPVPTAFSGPDACDNPGSGCALEKLLDDPDPGTGCGFPGSTCP